MDCYVLTLLARKVVRATQGNNAYNTLLGNSYRNSNSKSLTLSNSGIILRIFRNVFYARPLPTIWMKSNNISSFDKISSKTEMGENFVKKLRLIHIEIEKLKKEKTSTYSYIFTFMIIGCVLIISQFNSIYDFEVVAYKRTSWFLVWIFIGIGLISLAFSKLIRYLKDVKIVKNEKAKIDSVLDKHQIKYTCNVEFGEKYHGNQDVSVELKSNSNQLKDSKITLKI